MKLTCNMNFWRQRSTPKANEGVITTRPVRLDRVNAILPSTTSFHSPPLICAPFRFVMIIQLYHDRSPWVQFGSCLLPLSSTQFTFSHVQQSCLSCTFGCTRTSRIRTHVLYHVACGTLSPWSLDKQVQGIWIYCNYFEGPGP